MHESSDVGGPTEIHLVDRLKKDALVDVVFVHGLGGNWKSTWMVDLGNPSTYWPSWLSEDVSEAQVWSAQYPAAPSLWIGRSLDFLHSSISLLDRLTHRIGNRQIIFICRSLGGLVAKQMLRAASDLTATDDFRTLGANVVGIAFLGTPHTGASLADTVVTIARFLGAFGETARLSKAIENLQKQNAYLGNLNDWFRAAATSRSTRVIVYAEGVPTDGTTIVDINSANPNLLGVIPIPVALHHLELAKPQNREDQVAEGAKKFVRSIIFELNAGKGNGRALPPTIFGDPIELRFITAFEEVRGAVRDLALAFNRRGIGLVCYLKRIDDHMLVVNITDRGNVEYSLAYFIKKNSKDQIVYCSPDGERCDRNSWWESAQLNDDGKTFHINKVATKVAEGSKRYSRLSSRAVATYLWKNIGLSNGTPFYD
jgi:hypothetical protein